MTFSDLRQKDVINICDGRNMGKPTDVILSENACIEAILVPAPGSILNLFKPDKGCITIEWSHVRRIGDDVILVDFNK